MVTAIIKNPPMAVNIANRTTAEFGSKSLPNQENSTHPRHSNARVMTPSAMPCQPPWVIM